MQDIPQDFIDVSRAIGADPLLIQGAGGNTSIKIDERLMWVKASGKWLQNACDEDVFVAVDWARVNANIAAGADPVEGADLNPGPASLRPSIETTLHSLMPHKVVFHTHSVNAIVHAIQSRAADILAPKLDGLAWAFVPYSKPGMPLTELVADILGALSCDVLVIQNHGLVVGGDSPTETLARMNDIENRLNADAAALATPDRKTIAEACAGSDFIVAERDIIHQMALHTPGFELARAGSLYPDHVVFLGSGVAGVTDAAALAAYCADGSDDPLRAKAVALKDVGVAYHKSLNAGGVEMLAALAEIARRAPDADIRYLSQAEERELVDWDAEKYRQTLED